MFESFYQMNYQDEVYNPLTLREKKTKKSYFSPFLVKALPCIGPLLQDSHEGGGGLLFIY
jgi:hypothetical protein